MADFTLYIGNKNYSSWSFRAWLALTLTGAPFREVLFHLGDPASRPRIREVSPGGRVPSLHHGDLVVWDSIAIAEYLAELFPEAGLWPGDRAARATARSAVAEMHSGFQALRRHLPFNVRRRSGRRDRNAEVDADIARIEALWADLRARFGGDGPYLLGSFGLADVFYAPVAGRFLTYDVALQPESRDYVGAVWAHPAVRDWVSAAEAEPMTEPEYDL